MTRARLLPFAFLSLALALGCSSADPKRAARVSGTVKYKGLPLKAAALSFHTPEGEVYGAMVNSDGSYLVAGAPVGDMVVTVDTEVFNKDKKQEGKYADRYAKQMNRDSRRPPEGAGADKTSDYVKIPAKYADKEKSPLKVSLVKGDNKHDLELTD